MGYKPLNMPNNFMLGSKPLYPAVYDENITPLEQMNKLAEKLNEIVASDTNIKNDVEKLLGVWKTHFMAKSGYIEPLETIYSKNDLMLDVNSDDLIDMQYINRKNRYKPITLNVNGSFNHLIYQYYDKKFITFKDIYTNNDSTNIYLNSIGDNFKYRIIAQNENYTKYFYLNISVIDIIEPEDINIVTDLSNSVTSLYSNIFQNHYLHTDKTPELMKIEWFFSYDYGMGEEVTKIGENQIDSIKLIDIKVSHDIYSFDSWLTEEQMSARESNAVINNLNCELNKQLTSTTCELKIILKCTLGNKVSEKTFIILPYGTGEKIDFDYTTLPVFSLNCSHESADSNSFGYNVAGNEYIWTRYQYTNYFDLSYNSTKKAHLFYFSLVDAFKTHLAELLNSGTKKITYSDYPINPSVNNYSRLIYSSMIGEWFRFDYYFLYIFYQ